MTPIKALTTLTQSENHLYVRWHKPGIAEVVLADPARRNAMSAPMTQAWGTVMQTLVDVPELRAVLVRGHGKAFCAGGDLGWLAGGGTSTVTQLSERMHAFYSSWLSVVSLPVPTVAYINGPAIGAGAAIALACDIRWVGKKARMAVPFTRLGLHPGMGTTYLLTRAVGQAMATDLLLTGRSLDAEQMLTYGAATDTVPRAEVMARMAQIARTAPIAARLTKQAMQQPPQTLADALRWDGLAQPVTMTTEDVQEGLAAARERREAEFGNR